jgi:DHA1 family tetracycline resistance protein-like MFS transporter
MKNRKASILFIFITLVLDSTGLGIVIPVLPDVTRKFISDPSEAARTYGYFIAIYALFVFVSSPLLGKLSDRFGRRPILLVALAGAALDYLFMAFAPTLPLLFLGRIISGITGASFTVASAYIADISNNSNRSKNFGMIGAGFGLGFILGPVIGGFLGSKGMQYPFIAAAIFNFLNFIFGLFVLPESLPVEKRRKIQWKQLNPLRSFSIFSKFPEITLLVVVFFLLNLAHQTHPSMWTIYTEHRYGWTPAQVGISLTFVGVLSAISQGFLTGYFVKHIGEKKLVIGGLFGEAFAFAAFGLATTGTALYIVLFVGSLFWACHPAIQSQISHQVSASEQGELQGALMSLASVTSILNPVMMTWLFAMTSDSSGSFYIPGSPYLLAGFIFLMAWIIAMYWYSKHRVAKTLGMKL